MGICDLLFWLLCLELVCVYPLPLPLFTDTNPTIGLVHILSSDFLLGNISQSQCKFFFTK